MYRSIVPGLERLGIDRYEVSYNVVSPGTIRPKESYGLHDPVQVVSVGRQFHSKNPENLIRALVDLPHVRLTLIGDGPLHGHLVDLVEQCQLAERVTFHRALPNDELCRRLPEFDIFAVHTDYAEISKAVLEALLTGLPVVINRPESNAVPELDQDICVFTDNSVSGYGRALGRLIADDGFRRQLGRRARDHAQARWAPDKTEAKYVAIYRRLLAETGGSS